MELGQGGATKAPGVGRDGRAGWLVVFRTEPSEEHGSTASRGKSRDSGAGPLSGLSLHHGVVSGACGAGRRSGAAQDSAPRVGGPQAATWGGGGAEAQTRNFSGPQFPHPLNGAVYFTH